MLQRIKRLFNTDRFIEGSIRLMDMTGNKGEKQPAFDHRQAIRSFNSWVYAAASINAFACAATPLRLYVKKGAGTKVFNTRQVPLHRKRYLLGDAPGSQQPSARSIRKLMEFGGDFEEVSDSHPILDLLSNVNPVYNGFDLTATRILYGELTGNAYLAVILDEALGVPSQMWTMPSQWTFVQPDEDQFIRGYAYAAPGNQQVEFTREEVIHFRRPNPNDLFYGMGKVEAAWGTVGVNQAIHNMDLSTFENHARPDYAVVVKGPTGESSLKRFEEYVSERLQGTRKAGRFLTMTGDVQLTPLNFPPKDLSGREEVVEEIAAVFGVPVSMLKANDPNLASAQTGFAQWREGTILPLLRMDEDELNQSLIPMFGLEGDAMLCYDNPVPRDEQFELAKMQSAIAGGWMTINEARESQGMEPVDNELADEPLINGQPLGGTPTDDIGFGFNGYGYGDDDDTETKPGYHDDDDDETKQVEEPTEEPPTLATFNGPQIASFLKVLEGVKAGTLSQTAAIELIAASGLDREAATRMVRAQEPTPERKVERNPEDLYETAEEAEAVAEAIGCAGHHVHEIDGTTFYMPCAEMSEYTEITGDEHTDEDDPTLVDAKDVDDVDLKPTSEMAEMAARGLELRAEYGRGGTEVGVARARNIKNRDNLSPETVARMSSFFARHRVDLDAPAAKPGHDDYPSAGVIAWLLWGGDPNDPDGAGAGWATRKVEELAGEKSADCCGHAKHVKQSELWAAPGDVVEKQIPPGYEDKRRWLARSEKFEKALDRVMAKALKRVIDDLRGMKNVSQAAAQKILDKHINETFANDIAKASRTYVRESIADGVKHGDGQMIRAGFAPGEIEEAAKRRLEKIVDKQVARLAGEVTKYTRVRLRELVGDGIEKGETVDQLGKRVQTWAGEKGDTERGTRARARTIARTETTRASIEGQIQSYEESGVVAGKRWVLAPNPCEFCEKVARTAKTTGLRDNFLDKGTTLTGTKGGTMKLDYEAVNGAPLHPNCRCAVEPILRSEMT